MDEKLQELLGLTESQFKQIVLLPQGEFRKFLEAKNEEKQVIFRKIFETDFYHRFAVTLSDQEKTLQQQISAYRQKADALLHSFPFTQEEQVAIANENTRLSFLQQRVKELEEQCQRISLRLNCLDKDLKGCDLAAIEEKNRKHTLLQQSKEQLVYLQKQKDAVEEKKKLLTKLLQTETIYVYEQSMRRQKVQLNSALLEREKEEKKWNSLQEQMRSFQKKEQKLPLLHSRLQQLQKETQTAAEHILILRQLEETQKKEEEQTAACAHWRQQLSQKRVILKAMSYQEEEQIKIQRLDNLTSLLQLIQLSNRFAREMQEAQNQYFSLYQARNHAIAAELAFQLEEGKPCPVCGSVSHPQPAVAPEKIPTQEEVEQANQTVLSKREQTAATSAKAKALAEKLAQEFDPVELLTDRLFSQEEKLLSLIEEEKKQLVLVRETRLETEKDISFPLSPLSDKQQITQQAAQLEGQIQVTQNACAVLQKEKSALQYRLPEGMRRIEQGQKIHACLQQRQRDLEKELTDTEQKKASLREEFVTGKQRWENAEKQAVQEQHRLEEEIEKLKEAFQNSAFSSREEYLSSRESLPEKEKIQRELDSYHQQVAITRQRLESLQQELGESKPVDLEAVRTRRAQLEQERQQTDQKRLELHSQLERLRALLEQLSNLFVQQHPLEAQYGEVAQLAKLTNGDNALRMSFESYVLAGYFEEILFAANQRLDEMTGGRFMLLRKEEKEKYGRASGLGFRIFDQYTGKEREISTLSGGESFQVSLALALGLSEVVQHSSGGTRIETMLIDEGFGSLDEKALDQAVSVLEQLGKEGRTIGIISHVPELKERLSSRIQVTSSPNGSLEVRA